MKISFKYPTVVRSGDIIVDVWKEREYTRYLAGFRVPDFAFQTRSVTLFDTDLQAKRRAAGAGRAALLALSSVTWVPVLFAALYIAALVTAGFTAVRDAASDLAGDFPQIHRAIVNGIRHNINEVLAR